jgi:glycosyltransferase involved in cell wall biosynthesis
MSDRMKPKIFIATPCHDRRVHQQFHNSMLRLMASGLAEWKHCTESGGGVALARNQQAATFLQETNYDYLLSLDSDLQFDPGMVQRLVEHDKDFVCLTYAHKSPRVAWSCEAFPGADTPEDQCLWPMLAVGGGFQLVKRHVFERIFRTFPGIYSKDRTSGKWMWDFYGNGVVRDDLYGPDPVYLTEDWYFCYRAIKCGYTVWMDRSVYPLHYGDCAFPVAVA